MGITTTSKKIDKDLVEITDTIERVEVQQYNKKVLENDKAKLQKEIDRINLILLENGFIIRLLK